MGKEEEPLRLVIGVPSNDTIQIDTAMCITNLVAHCIHFGVAVGVVNEKTSLVHVGRNAIVENALKMDADYLLFLDTDMLFPRDLVQKLMAHKRSVVCCDAVRRRPPFSTVVTPVGGGSIDHNNCEELVEVEGASGAILLVDMKVFKTLEYPYFDVKLIEGEKREWLGEDYYFTKKVRESGRKVWCDTKASLEIGHIGTRGYMIPREQK
jgi:hypothetical protein